MKYRLKLRKIELLCGERVPDFYGIGYHDYAMNITYCYPIPLNVLVRWREKIRWWIKIGMPLVAKKAYVKGYADGVQFERQRQTMKQIEDIIRGSVSR